MDNQRGLRYVSGDRSRPRRSTIRVHRPGARCPRAPVVKYTAPVGLQGLSRIKPRVCGDAEAANRSTSILKDAAGSPSYPHRTGTREPDNVVVARPRRRWNEHLIAVAEKNEARVEQRLLRAIGNHRVGCADVHTIRCSTSGARGNALTERGGHGHRSVSEVAALGTFNRGAGARWMRGEHRLAQSRSLHGAPLPPASLNRLEQRQGGRRAQSFHVWETTVDARSRSLDCMCPWAGIEGDERRRPLRLL